MKSSMFAALCFLFITILHVATASWFSSTFHALESLVREPCYSLEETQNDISPKLQTMLHRKVFGQPFITDVLLPLIQHHTHPYRRNNKALVISCHGTPGSGKNYVAKILAEALYEKGLESRFVHLYKPVLHFLRSPPEILKLRLQDWIISNVTACDRQLFIFDEVNDMPEGILEAVKGFIDYNPRFGGLDFSNCIFIFLSNIAMVPINNRALELWQSGVKDRSEFALDDFKSVIVEHAFNEQGGLRKCNLISSRLIDAFIPFLPLERSHVESCIQAIAKEYTPSAISSSDMKSIVSRMDFSPPDIALYAKHGCKNLETPIKLIIFQQGYRLNDEL